MATFSGTTVSSSSSSMQFAASPCRPGNFISAGTLAQLRDVSLDFAPPEVVRALQAGKFQMKVEPSADVWALGMVAYELLTRSRAFPSGMDQDEICDQITGKSPLPWENEMTKRDKLNKLKQLKPSVLRCLSRDPLERPTVEQLHAAWIRTLDLVKSSERGDVAHI
jgi:serine/threonine protein kinase